MSAIRRLAKYAFSAVEMALPRHLGPRILIYHQIGAGNHKQMDLGPHDFASHLRLLDEGGFRPVDLATAWERRADPDSHRLVVLTFDDGYESMVDNAFPLLADRGWPFTLYLTTNPTETRTPLDGDARSSPASWDQVGMMLESGLMTLGAHTHTHPDLRTATTSQVEDEIERSHDLIERRLGVRPAHFAYPWGYWSEAAHGPVSSAYTTATLGGGAPVTGQTDPHLLNRIPVQLSDGSRFFAAKIKRGQRTEEWVRRRLTGYRGP